MFKSYLNKKLNFWTRYKFNVMNNLDPEVFSELINLNDLVALCDLNLADAPDLMSDLSEFDAFLAGVDIDNAKSIKTSIARIHKRAHELREKEGHPNADVVEAKMDAKMEEKKDSDDQSYVSNVTEWDVLHANLIGNGPAQERLRALLDIKFTSTELSTILQCLKKTDYEQWKPIQILTHEQIQRSRVNTDTIIVHSVEFMREYHKKVPATRKYSPEGVEYTYAGKTARVYRGVPKTEEDAKLLSLWLSTPTKIVLVPYEPMSNKRLGALLSCVEQSKVKLVNSPCHPFAPDPRHPLAGGFKNQCANYLNDLIESTSDAGVRARLIHAIQDKLMRDTAIHPMLDKIIAFNDKKWAGEHEERVGEGAVEKREFVGPIPEYLSEIPVAINRLNTNKTLRNHGIGEDIWHRLVNNMPGANYDIHESQLYATIPFKEGKTAVLGGHNEHMNVIRSLKTSTTIVEARFAGPGKVDIDGANRLLVLNVVKNTPKVTGTQETHAIKAAFKLDYTTELPVGFTLLFRFNALSLTKEMLDNMEYQGVFRGWAYKGLYKSGGLHTPDGIHEFEYTGKIDAKEGTLTRVTFETRIRHLLGFAAVGDSYMNLMRMYGQLDTMPKFDQMFVSTRATKTCVFTSKTMTFHKELVLGQVVEHVSVSPSAGLDEEAAKMLPTDEDL